MWPGNGDEDIGVTGPGAEDAAIGAVLQAMRALALGLDRYRQALGVRYSIGVTEIVALSQLLFDAPVRASEVSERTGLTQSSVTALLDRLEGRGLVTRVRPAENRRVVLVEPTATGRELGRAIVGPVRQGLRNQPPDAPALETLAECLQYAAAFLGRAASELREGEPE